MQAMAQAQQLFPNLVHAEPECPVPAEAEELAEEQQAGLPFMAGNEDLCAAWCAGLARF